MELVLAAPVVLLILAAVVDYGLAMRDVETLRAAIRVSAEVAATLPRDPETKHVDRFDQAQLWEMVYFGSNHDAGTFAPKNYLGQTVTGYALKLPERWVWPEAKILCTCPGSAPTEDLTICAQPTGPFCPDGQRATKTVQISASRSFQQYFPFAAPWLPDLQGEVVNRICPTREQKCMKGITVTTEVRVD